MAMSEIKKLLPGFRFCPSDQELITFYLKPKILKEKLAYNIINEIELYGPNSTPWQLFDVEDDESWTDKLGEKYLYVFTTLSKSRCSESSKPRIRENTRKKAGCGNWNAKTKRKPIRDCKRNVIGEQRMLVFEINDTSDQFDLAKAGYFKMHEYSLAGINKGLKSVAGGDVVLCKITFDSSKSPVFKLGSKSVDYGPTNKSEGHMKEENFERSGEENFERSVGNNLEETSNLTPTSVVDINSGSGNNVEASTSEQLFAMNSGSGNNVEASTSEQLFAMNSDCSDSYEYPAATDNGWDPSFRDWFTGFLATNPDEWEINISNLGKRKFQEENFCGSKKIRL